MMKYSHLKILSLDAFYHSTITSFYILEHGNNVTDNKMEDALYIKKA